MLQGVTVLDLASVGPAARASRWLGDFGARIIKVGPVPKAAGVQITPPVYAYGGHRGTERAQFDLKSDEGKAAFLALAAKADVIIESFRPGVVDRLGIGYEAAKESNPAIVYCSTSGYGQTGPKSSWAGHDINYLASGGYLACSGRNEAGGPALPGATIADGAAGGMHAVTSILAALVQKSSTGEGAFLDVSIADGVVGLMSLFVDEYLATGTEPGPRHNLLTGQYAWYDVYAGSDDRWIAVGAIEPHFFVNLCNLVGCEQWIGHQYDQDAIEQMRTDFTAAFATKTAREWVDLLGPADTCVSAVAEVSELVEDPQYVERGLFIEASHPTEGDFTQVGAVFAGQSTEGLTIPDVSVTNTEALLAEAGLSAEDISKLADTGAIA